MRPFGPFNATAIYPSPTLKYQCGFRRTQPRTSMAGACSRSIPKPLRIKAFMGSVPSEFPSFSRKEIAQHHATDDLLAVFAGMDKVAAGRFGDRPRERPILQGFCVSRRRQRSWQHCQQLGDLLRVAGGAGSDASAGDCSISCTPA